MSLWVLPPRLLLKLSVMYVGVFQLIVIDSHTSHVTSCLWSMFFYTHS